MPHPPASAAVHHICSMHAPLTRSPSAPPPPSRSVASDLARATGLADAAAAASNRLNKIVQLTGFSDPIYAEAYVTGAAQLPVLPAGVVLCGSQGHLHCSVAGRTPMLCGHPGLGLPCIAVVLPCNTSNLPVPPALLRACSAPVRHCAGCQRDQPHQ